MPETVPRWLLIGAGIVAVIIILVEIKDFAERKSAVRPPSATSSAAFAHSDAKSPPKTTPRKRRARASATAMTDSAAERLAGDTLGQIPTMEGIVQAGARAPFVTDDQGKGAEPGAGENQVRAVPVKCVPLPNSTQPGDVDVPYYENWAREYGCGINRRARAD